MIMCLHMDQWERRDVSDHVQETKLWLVEFVFIWNYQDVDVVIVHSVPLGLNVLLKDATVHVGQCYIMENASIVSKFNQTAFNAL